MYCEKCGQQIPEGATECPKCAQARANLNGEIFEFQYTSGMSSRSISEVHHTITFQSNGMAVKKEKSLTIFKKKTRPAITQFIEYHDIIRVHMKTSISPIEIPVILLCILLVVAADGFLYTAIWLILAGISLKWAIMTTVLIELKNGEAIRIPYSGKKEIAVEFIQAVNTAIK